MQGLRRHRLVHLSAEGWSGVLRRAWEPKAQAFLAQWSGHGLPLVVTRQPPEYAAQGKIALGLPSALAWGKLRLAVQVPEAAVRGFDSLRYAFWAPSYRLPRPAAVSELVPSRFE